MEPPGDPKAFYANTGEAEIVPLYQIAPILKKWIDEWYEDHDVDYDDHFLSPYEYLSMNSGDPPVHPRRVRAIANGDTNYFKGLVVPLSDADALLCAAGLPGYLYDKIQVLPNPTWNLEKWIAYMEERGCA